MSEFRMDRWLMYNVQQLNCKSLTDSSKWDDDKMCADFHFAFLFSFFFHFLCFSSYPTMCSCLWKKKKDFFFLLKQLNQSVKYG